MAGRSLFTRVTMEFIVAILLAIPFPGQIADAGTIWHEGPAEFTKGSMDKLFLGSEGLSIDLATNMIINQWINMTPLIAPPKREGISLAYDNTQDEMVLFSGHGGQGIGYYCDTWIYNLTTNYWRNMNPSIQPPARTGYAMVYNSVFDEMVLFGGNDPHGAWFNDTWTYNFTTNEWKSKNPTNSPPGREGHAMAYDNNNDKIVIFGGKSIFGTMNDTWIYDLTTNTWTNQSPPIAPKARDWSALAYGNILWNMVLFGGIVAGNYYCLNDTWTYNITNNTWTNMSPSNAPSTRLLHTMVYNNASNEMVLFGGNRYNDPLNDELNPLNDTWIYNLTINNWIKQNLEIAPPAREGHAMAYDIAKDTVVLFGGSNRNESDPKNASTLADTWTLKNKIYYNDGIYTSNPQDSGGIGYFGTISWTGHIPSSTSLRFQFRSADTKEKLMNQGFTGPDGTINSYYEIDGQHIAPLNNGTRWFQYRAYFVTNDNTITPLLRSVTVRYNLLHSISILSPVSDESWTGPHNITWSASDMDNDSLAFDIYLENESAKIPLAKDLNNDSRKWLWNTDIIQNGTYWIRITARDDNPSIPLSVDAISEKFTIQHPAAPPVNHLPHVTLISPPDKSFRAQNTAHLLWFGTDPDGDPLTYTVNYSDRPFSQGAITTQTTTSEFLDLSNLSDNTTYYWTVSASDGKSNSTDIPTETWSFTVRLPPANIPVRFTSTPNTTAWVGKEYTYNLTSIDEDGDIPTYSIVSVPSGMTLDPSTGRLRWTPTTADIGNRTITLRVSDGRGSTDNQTFTITVKETPVPPVFPPKCAITYPVDGARINGTIQIKGTAINGSLPLSVIKVRIDNGTWTIAIGLENWTFALDTAELAKGSHRIEAKSFAANLSSETVSVDFTVKNPEPDVSAGGNQWCLPAVVVAIIAGISVLVLLRKKKR